MQPSVFLVSVLAVASPALADIAAEFAPVPSGAMKEIGYYIPQRVELSTEKPESLTRAPADLSAPLYGEIAIGVAPGGAGARKFLVIVDEPDDRDARLFVDANGNGDLTDDPPAEWTTKLLPADGEKEFRQFSGGASVEIGTPDRSFPAHLGMYRFDKTDPRRDALKNTLLYYRDYATKGTLGIGDRTLNAMLADEMVSGDFRGKLQDNAPEGEINSGVRLLIDVNANGKFDSRGEAFDVHEPFNIGGTTYEIADLAADGTRFRLVKSLKTVKEISPPPDHGVGKPILAFKATTMDGKTVNFPEDYKGKIVMLDFWATWCGPCMREVPALVETYESFHDKGFEVLGVTLDKEGAAEKVTSTCEKHRMAWPQIYDGKYWDAEIASAYVIRSIPAAFLVDGDTGLVLATGGSLHGEELKKTIDRELARKFPSPQP